MMKLSVTDWVCFLHRKIFFRERNVRDCSNSGRNNMSFHALLHYLGQGRDMVLSSEFLFRTNGLRLPLVLMCAIVLAVSAAGATESVSPLGLWHTIDDHTGKPRGLVRVYEQDSQFFARIEASLIPGESDEVCEACRDDRKNQPITGLVIMRNIKRRGAEYGGGDILDPDTGAVYDCEFHLDHDGSRMVVRGFIGLSLFGRSQTWVRVE
jgi:uncharacterized protein (DUF2147 family)